MPNANSVSARPQIPLAAEKPAKNIATANLRLDTPPSPGRMAVAIAGYPYSMKAAMFDLIDNSVENGASGVLIKFEQTTTKELSRIIITDDGTGIPREIFDEVLRAGSRTSHLYSDHSLARYGIGLKGAGFSLGSRIIVLTKFGGEPHGLRTIDLEEIVATDTWFQETRDPTSDEVGFFNSSREMLPGRETQERREERSETGTSVTIEKLNIRSRDVSRLKNDLIRSMGEVYAKFLGLEGKLYIRVDDTDIQAVDPLHRENDRTVVLFRREEIPLSNGASVFFSGVVLPHPNQVDADTSRHYRYSQQNQGVYVYRNGRMIMTGDTLGMFSRDFHLNAFRAELEYTSNADEHILVDVAKSNANISPELEGKLEKYIETCRKTAQTLWREKDVLTPEAIMELFEESNRQIGSRANLLVDIGKKVAEEKRKASTTMTKPLPGLTVNNKKPKGDVPYLMPRETLPGDVLYQPVYNGEVNGVVVEVNLSHPFSKAVFSVPPGEGKSSLPRKATTATQQLLYVLGRAEWGLSGDDENRDLLHQFRRYASMNLRGLLE